MLVYFNKTKDTYHLRFSQAGQISFEHSEALTQSPPLHRDLYLNDFEDLALCFQPENIKNKNTLTIVCQQMYGIVITTLFFQDWSGRQPWSRPGKSVQCSSDPEFAFFKCSSNNQIRLKSA